MKIMSIISIAQVGALPAGAVFEPSERSVISSDILCVYVPP
jgi:hypothetical protein